MKGQVLLEADDPLWVQKVTDFIIVIACIALIIIIAGTAIIIDRK